MFLSTKCSSDLILKLVLQYSYSPSKVLVVGDVVVIDLLVRKFAVTVTSVSDAVS